MPKVGKKKFPYTKKGKAAAKKARKMPKGKGKAVGSKISKIMHEGVRRNTRKPVSAKNPRRKVGQKQAVAIAMNMARRGKI